MVFLATANDTRSIPPPLLDRMELIPLSAYTFEEKRHIALRHLAPRQLAEHGLQPRHLEFPAEVYFILLLFY